MKTSECELRKMYHQGRANRLYVYATQCMRSNKSRIHCAQCSKDEALLPLFYCQCDAIMHVCAGAFYRAMSAYVCGNSVPCEGVMCLIGHFCLWCHYYPIGTNFTLQWANSPWPTGIFLNPSWGYDDIYIFGSVLVHLSK